MLRFYDTAEARVTELVPRDEGKISMYVCGPTVYGAPHIGHGRSTLVYDVLRRYLSWRGFEVRHVSNITDIDDKIIERARSEARPWQEIVAECEQEWWTAMDALGVQRPTVVPHATEYVTQMVELIATLLDSGAAYSTSDGVYLECSKVPGYGLLAHQDLDSLRAGARVDVVEDKRSSSDFALWKLAKPGEPTWPSPFGDGRPGWHTECVVMSLALLGEGFDLHGGGLDLMFPHHENERAQAVALGRRFAGHWVHHGMVTVGGVKMSKSLQNFETLAELLDAADPRSYRLLVLRSRYRSPLEVTDETLADAAASIERIDALARRFPARAVLDQDAGTVSADVSADVDAKVTALREHFVAAMDDDLDTPTAIGELFESLRQANALADAGSTVAASALAGCVLELFGAVGVFARSDDELPPDVEALLRAVDAARAARDFATADRARGELEGLGWKVENTAEGTRVHR